MAACSSRAVATAPAGSGLGSEPEAATDNGVLAAPAPTLHGASECSRNSLVELTPSATGRGFVLHRKTGELQRIDEDGLPFDGAVGYV